MDYELLLVHPIVVLEIIKKCCSTTTIPKKTKRQVGCLLGYVKKTKISCTSSFFIPFEEKNTISWFLDHNFIKKMKSMYKKINNKEFVIGWYSKTQNLHKNDINITRSFLEYVSYPVQLLVWLNDKQTLFLRAFIATGEFLNKEAFLTNIRILIGVLESEEVTIFHLLKYSKTIKTLIYSDSVQVCFRIIKSYIQYIRFLFEKINQDKKHTSRRLNLKKIQFLLKKFTINSKQKYFSNKKMFWYIFSLTNILINIE